MKGGDSQCERMKAVAWQIVGGNYGPWFTCRTRFLYDIYSAIQHEQGGALQIWYTIAIGETNEESR